jgi:radical SAM superfamily enzyme YgiQ (UPF0313 family)
VGLRTSPEIIKTKSNVKAELELTIFLLLIPMIFMDKHFSNWPLADGVQCVDTILYERGDVVMAKTRTLDTTYRGFEQGPIRPPSEARSLLVRITRNCPWNRCSFCPVYKGKRFSLRPVDHVIEDIEALHRHITTLKGLADDTGRVHHGDLNAAADGLARDQIASFQAALHWFAGGMRSVFLQDANSLIMPPRDLIRILAHIQKRFPWVERTTSYARSHTIARIKDVDLAAMATAGLNRIHIGLESGADEVLAMVKKGVTKATQIKAGRKVKRAGMQLSEYVMPGLGGKKLSRRHALESADALNQIDADFIRLRTLALPQSLELHQEYRQGRFEKLSDLEVVREIRLFIDNLEGIRSILKSDHILNLFGELEGRLPEDKPTMLAILDDFLAMDPEERILFQVGRRMGVFSTLQDMQQPKRRARVESVCQRSDITEENVDEVIDEMMTRFI